MLTDAIVSSILDRLPSLRIGVVGDLFLDRYLDIDARLTERSIETGLDAYQVVNVRNSPGAAGTIINNLTALSVGKVSVLSVIGQDGEGFVLRRRLDRAGVNLCLLVEAADRFTPTYTKPMLSESGQPARELNRLDIKNRSPLAMEWEDMILRALPNFVDDVDTLILLDQVTEPNCGVITERVRHRISNLADRTRDKFILADSRKHIGHFRNMYVKPNRNECQEAVPKAESLKAACEELSRQVRRPVFCTQGEEGILLVDPTNAASPLVVPGYPVTGPIDPVGAGDATSAGIACAVAAGATLAAAAAFGNLIASITIQQIGTTGTATPEQVRARWQECKSKTAN